MTDGIHVQRFPCPLCHSRRTIQLDTTAHTETLQCPDCEHRWVRVVPPVRSAARPRQVSAPQYHEH